MLSRVDESFKVERDFHLKMKESTERGWWEVLSLLRDTLKGSAVEGAVIERLVSKYP